MRKMILATLLGLAFALALSLAGQSVPPAPPPVPVNCYETVAGSKCGTDIELSYMTCDGQRCVLLEKKYDNLSSTRTSTSGLSSIQVKKCYEHLITRDCIADSKAMRCVLVSEELHETTSPGTEACRNVCTRPTTQPTPRSP